MLRTVPRLQMASKAIQGLQKGQPGGPAIRAPLSSALLEPWPSGGSSSSSTDQHAAAEVQAWDEAAAQCSCVLGQLAPGAAAAVATTPLGRGLVATQALRPGEIVLSVPAHNLLSVGFDPRGGAGAAALQRWQAVHGALPRRLASFLLEGRGALSELTRLVAWLLWLRRHPPSAAWRGYCSLLPQDGAVSGPLFTWSDAELAALQSPGAAAAAQRHRRVLAHMHDGLFCCDGGQLAELRLAPGGLRDVLWAAGAVSSRLFSLQMGREAPALLAPCADLANHSPRPNAVFLFDEERAAMQLLALEARGGGAPRELRPGDEVCLSYGAGRSNADLLRGYGFTLPGNLADRVELAGAGESEGEGEAVERAGCSLSAPHLLSCLGLRPAAAAAAAAAAACGSRREAAAASGQLDAAAAGGQLGLEALGEELLGREDAAAVQQRRLLAALASLQPFFRTPGCGAAARQASGCATGGNGGSSSSNSGGATAPPALPAADRQRERQAAERLRMQCLQQLADPPTSLSEDEAALAAGGAAGTARSSQAAAPAAAAPLSANLRAAVVARAERKRLLLTLHDVLRRYCDALG